MSEQNPKFWSKRNTDYVEKWSQHQIEDNQGFQVRYFQLDVEKSKVNFYGEIVVKKFVDSKGVLLKGTIEIKGESRDFDHNISKRTTLLNFGCYIKTLREINVNPQIGDYFVVKNKWYVISEKTPIDDNQVTVAFNSAISIRFTATQIFGEELANILWEDIPSEKEDGTFIERY